MAGNVWEWTSSLYKKYPYDSTDGREDLEVYSNRTVRGGAWQNKDNVVRCANREFFRQDKHSDSIGFRVLSSDS
jgi:formylglycine-generating enzyme required for sulfatase activity